MNSIGRHECALEWIQKYRLRWSSLKIHSGTASYTKKFIDIVVASIHYSENINDTKILLGICSCLLKNTIGGQIDKKEIGITLQQYIVSFISFIFCLQNLLSILVLLYAAVCLLT